ncbi:hypothetical protein POSPLADRAFT_1046376 [Postia placenta MAD-698-R-SB12]|uniref:Uncharacterized protein n=1 Tax=Postia placenta MAD-698-R-SB12 TaxID=670580 RepID=A0A1X6N3I3_9APHY|nr:hypothetical protein POSPLADRAFT_1046376 [Postia placenta MAD-698-R-SB12]OSX63036.1 hypothetical protein POSPLADRAFT_1046376 [Postia placenta MAD-698-R-SB12]
MACRQAANSRSAASSCPCLIWQVHGDFAHLRARNIDAINQNVGKKLIVLSGKVDELWERMARHYSLNLAQAIEPALPASGPRPINKEIQCRQWAHLHDLTDECLPSTPSHQAETMFDTIRSWVEAAQAGNPYAIAGLMVAQWLLVPNGTSVAGPSSLLIHTVSMSNQVPTVNARLCTQYGGTQAWETIKVSMCCHEHLYGKLQDAFGGDKDYFYAFFAEPSDPQKRCKQDLLCLYRLVIEAIPHHKKDIAHEQLKPEYQDVFSTFSEHMNDWEIWWELGLEQYR